MIDPVNLKFLVVDDFPTMRRIVRGLLKELGYADVEEAENGVVALRKLLKEHVFVDLVIADTNTPQMNGFELVVFIKAYEALKHIPVLLMTAEAHKEGAARASQCGAAGYIMKPFTKAILWDRIQEVLGKPIAWR